VVGGQVFGDYGGHGFGEFFREVSSRVRDGNTVAWFLVLSPYLVWQVLRLTAFAWRLAGRPTGGSQTRPPDLA
jgi:hypothetical protein